MLKHLLIACFFIFSNLHFIGQDLVVNEFMASNSYVLSDNFDEFDDWIEIYNTTSWDINLAGYYFSDNPNKPFKYKVPSTNAIFTTIPAGGYLVFWADGDTLQGPTHLGFNLASGGEFISLTNPQGIVEDQFSFSEQEKNVSFARIPNGIGPFYFCSLATPYAENSSVGYNGFVKSNPVFSVNRGVYEASQTLELTKDFVSGEIRYTLNGTEPNLNSQLYASPISITQNTIVRAAVFQDSLVPSEIQTHSYIFDVVANQTLPVISIAGDSLLFYDAVNGLLTQSFLPSWEYEINFEIIDVGLGIDKSQEMGIEILQDEGWQLPQKPLNFRARDAYSKKSFKYKLFPDEDIAKFKSFSLRNGTTDWGSTLIKDGLAQHITSDNMSLDNRFYRPSSVYINGVWQGVYNIRVNTDVRYPEELYGYNKDSIDLIKGNGALEGSPVEYNSWLSTLQNLDLTDSLNFVSVANEMDIENYTHHILSLLFFGNENWATENSFQWKSKEGNSKWRWFLRGMDEGMNNVNIDSVLFYFITNPAGGVDNPEWLTRPIRKLLTNDDYRNYFLSQLADHYYITYNSVLLNEKHNDLRSNVDGYMTNHIALWNGASNLYADPISSYQAWDDSLTQILNWYTNRGGVVQTDAISYFPEISSSSNLNLQVQSTGTGDIAINNLIVPNENWTGVYFDSLSFTLTALPKPGFVFIGWENSGVPDSTQAQISILINQDTSITAHFQASPTPERNVLITEIKSVADTLNNVGDWVELYNPSSQWVSLSNWVFQNGSNSYILPSNAMIAPDSYLILANDKVSFLSWYSAYYAEDVSSQVFGNFDFGLSSDGGELRLLNEEDITVDSVEYFNVSPWPVVNSPDTLSIELVNYAFENEYGHNWYMSESYLGTPLNPSGFSSLHIGKIPNQDINIGDVFIDFDLNDFIFSPNIPVNDLLIEVSGNVAIQVSISSQQVVSLTYSNWKGVEWISFKISDTLGNYSIDSAQFLVGTILNQFPCNETYTIDESPILITDPITIPNGCNVTFLEGVEVRMKANTELIVKGSINFLGTNSDSIYLHAHLTEWNSILIDSSSTLSTFDFVSYQDATHGSDSVKMNAAISGFYGDFEVNNCTFLNTQRSMYGYHGEAVVNACNFNSSIGEKVNFQFTNASVVGCYFSPSFGDFDAIDFDAVNKGLIQGNTIVYGEDDGIDIGQIEGVVCDSLSILENNVNGLFDKAISVGEGSSNIFIERNVLTNSYYGVAVKDGSQAILDHNTVDGNSYAVALFEKNDGLAGSYAIVENSILSNSQISTSLIDGTSSAVFNYNCSNVDVIDGIGNIFDNPDFSSEYELEYYSPCINTGDPLFAFDDDQTQTDMGAKWFNTEDLENYINNEIIVSPNPVSNSGTFSLSWQQSEVGEQIVQIFDMNGKIVFERTMTFESVNPLGIQMLEISSYQLGSGVYLCRVLGMQDVLTAKFAVAP